MTLRKRRGGWLRAVELLCWVLAAVLLGFYGFVYLDRNVYQAYHEWAFDRQLEHRPAPVIGFLLHAFRSVTAKWAPPRGAAPAAADKGPVFSKPLPVPSRSAEADAGQPVRSELSHQQEAALPPGSLLGRIEIPKLGVRAMVADGTEDALLRRAVGHIEGTALPGQAGNVGLAGHRDTFFQGLRRVEQNDTIVFRTLEGTYEYAVESIRIVGPDDVEVLAATATPTLTLVTCYPFDYVGTAPRRFIVQAREISGPGFTPPPPPGF